MRPDIRRKTEILLDDAKEINALFKRSKNTILMNKLRAQVTLKFIIEEANALLKELEELK